MTIIKLSMALEEGPVDAIAGVVAMNWLIDIWNMPGIQKIFVTWNARRTV